MNPAAPFQARDEKSDDATGATRQMLYTDVWLEAQLRRRLPHRTAREMLVFPLGAIDAVDLAIPAAKATSRRVVRSSFATELSPFESVQIMGLQEECTLRGRYTPSCKTLAEKIDNMYLLSARA